MVDRSKVEASLAALTPGGLFSGPANVSAELLAPGATISGGSYTWPTLGSTNLVTLVDPGALYDGALVRPIINGTWQSSSLLVVGDPAISAGEWKVTLQRMSIGVAIVMNSMDSFVFLEGVAANRIFTAGQKAGGSLAQVTHATGSDGMLETFTNAERADILVNDLVAGIKAIRDVQLPWRHHMTPEAFGAKGDGVADDSLAVKKAIAHAGLLGGATVLLSRNYLTGAGQLIVDYDNVQIVGVGWNSGLKMTATAGILLTVNGANVGVSNLRLVGQTTTSAGTRADAVNVSGSGTGFSMQHVRVTGINNNAGFNVGVALGTACSQWSVDGCRMDRIIGTAAGYGIGVYARAATWGKVKENFIFHTATQGRHQILLDEGCQFCLVEGNQLSGGAGSQILLSSTQAQVVTFMNQVRGNICEGMQGPSGAASIHLRDNCTANAIAANNIMGPDPHGIHIEAATATAGSCPNNIVADNTIYSSEEEGLWVDGANGTHVSGGQVANSGQSAANTFANIKITVLGSAVADRCSVVGVYSLGTTQPQYAIRIYAGVTNTRVFSSVLIGGATGRYLNSGTGTVLAGNDLGVTQTLMSGGMKSGGELDMQQNSIDMNLGSIKHLRGFPRVAAVASAATINLDPADVLVEITGTTNISTINFTNEGRMLFLLFTNAAPGDLVTGGGGDGAITVAVTAIVQNRVVPLICVDNAGTRVWAPFTV